MMTHTLPTAKVRTCLWFEKDGTEAAEFWVSLLPDSRIERSTRVGEGAVVIDLTLAGAPFQILQAGPHARHSDAASISVLTEDQAETDRLWNALVADGGRPSRCGWLVDRFGVSWQIVPEALPRLLASEDRAAAGRVLEAMMNMDKIEIAALEAAARQT